jgi:hypothetical protein
MALDRLPAAAPYCVDGNSQRNDEQPESGKLALLRIGQKNYQ